MTIKDAIEQATLSLSQASSGRRDAQVLLSHVLGVERPTLYAYPEREITPEQVAHFFGLIERRKRGEPVAYLLGHKEFYSLDFLVDKRVLIPRPETELLVELALAAIKHKIADGQMPIVADIGTGSGAIPITIAIEQSRLPYLYACDISSAALEVAYLNCARHHVENRVRLLQGNLLEALPEAVDVLTANLPYVGTQEMNELASDVKDYEPHLALFSGLNGLDLLLHFCEDVRRSAILKPQGVMLLEIGYRQREALTKLFHGLWPQATITYTKDYAGWDRVLQLAL